MTTPGLSGTVMLNSGRVPQTKSWDGSHFLRIQTHATVFPGETAAMGLESVGPGGDPARDARRRPGRCPRADRTPTVEGARWAERRAGRAQGGRLGPRFLFFGMPDLERL